MLLGEYEHTIDDKNRLTLPAKFRQAFGGRDRRHPGARRLPLGVHARRLDSSSSTRSSRTLDPLSREGRVMERHFFSGAIEAELDKQGRVMIPAALIEHAKLGREVVVAGVYDHLEIWDRAAWREQLKEVEGSAEHVAERLAAQRD